MQSSCLDHARFYKSLYCGIDASGNAIGVVTMQEARPLAFASQPIKEKDLHKPICEKEMLAILYALK